MANHSLLASAYVPDIAEITARAERERMDYIGQMVRNLFQRVRTSSAASVKMGEPSHG